MNRFFINPLNFPISFTNWVGRKAFTKYKNGKVRYYHMMYDVLRHHYYKKLILKTIQSR